MSAAARSKSFARGGGRQRLIGALHAAAARRGVDEEARRDMMERLTGKRSAKDLTIPELNAVIDHLNGKRGEASDAGAFAFRAKIKALWISAAQLGVVRDASDRALDQFVKRQAGVEALRFVTAQDAPRVIEALKSWLARPVGQGGGGVIWPHNGDFEDREAIANAIWARLPDHVVRCDDYCRGLLGIAESRALRPDEWGRALPLLAEILKSRTESRQ